LSRSVLTSPRKVAETKDRRQASSLRRQWGTLPRSRKSGSQSDRLTRFSERLGSVESGITTFFDCAGLDYGSAKLSVEED
jgi:hypothetical protein